MELRKPSNAMESKPFNWVLLWELVQTDLKFILLAGISSMLVGVMNLWIPIAVGTFISRLSTVPATFDEEFFWKMIEPGMKIGTLFAVQTVATSIYSIAWAIVRERLTFRLMTKLFSSILQQEMSFFDQHQTGELLSRLTTDTQSFIGTFHICTSDGLRNMIQVVGSIILMFINAPRLTTVLCVTIPVFFKLGDLLCSNLMKLADQAHKQAEKAMAVAQECLGNVRSVRTLALEDKIIKSFEDHTSAGMKLKEMLNLWMNVQQTLWNAIISGMFLGVGYYGSTLISKGVVSSGNMVIYVIYADTLKVSLAQFFSNYKDTKTGKIAGMRAFEYITRIPRMSTQGGQILPKEMIHGDIRFEGVTFRYPTRPAHIVLDNFNLSIEPGQTAVLGGRSGGGKSTIAALLLRMYDIELGKILIDGIDITCLDPQWLRAKFFGYISQEPILFATSVKENIRLGNPEATDYDIVEAAKLANAHDFICGFPNGYKTMIGEQGLTVSGGQRQRIAIARAFVKNPPVLILDEATSALDNESEHLVLEALDKISKGRTVLIMTHRPGPLKYADVVTTIEGGSSVEKPFKDGIGDNCAVTPAWPDKWQEHSSSDGDSLCVPSTIKQRGSAKSIRENESWPN